MEIMKKSISAFFCSIIVILVFVCGAIAENESPSYETPEIIGKACFSVGECEEKSENRIITARRGCCSWHQGVCGCSSGRALCCDGSLSPSCGCD